MRSTESDGISPVLWGTKREKYHHEEAKEIWELILQLQGFLFPGAVSPG